MGKTKFSSTSKNRTNSVSQIKKPSSACRKSDDVFPGAVFSPIIPANPLYTDRLASVIFWTSQFVILGVSSLFCRFYSIFDGKSSKQIM